MVKQNVKIGAIALSWMPDGNGSFQPTPDLLTQKEAIRFLRLDTIQTRFPQNTLQRYRKESGLKTVQLGKQILYPKKTLEEFIERQMAKNPR